MKTTHIMAVTIAVVLVASGVMAQVAVSWPHHSRLVRAIDNSPETALDWLAENLTEAQREDFISHMLGVPTDEERITSLEAARATVEYYGDKTLADKIVPELDAKIEETRLKLVSEEPVTPVEEKTK